MALKDESCTACGADAAQVSESEQQTLLAQLPQWQLVNEEGEPRLLRAFEFPDFRFHEKIKSYIVKNIRHLKKLYI